MLWVIIEPLKYVKTVENNDNNIKEEDDESGAHKCPYCDYESVLINDHFSHIEWEHPDKPLV